MSWFYVRFKEFGGLCADEALIAGLNHGDVISKLYDVLAAGKEEVPRLDWIDCRIFDGPVVQ
ncbi:MAG: hypothetical protein M0R49_09990 [Limnochordia bacterium]|nr:hypothetical protein [Limnochordia bacterium]